MLDAPIPIEACTLPGSIEVSKAALDRARAFKKVIPAGWTVAFSWYDDERWRANKDAPWIEKGPGLDLGAYQDYQLPREALYHSGDLQYAVCIGKEIVAAHPQKAIDLDERGNPVLR